MNTPLKIQFFRISFTLVVALLWVRNSAFSQTLPVNPNATAEAKMLLKYLHSIKGKGILSGQTDYVDGEKAEKNILTDVGKKPAIYGNDFGWGGQGSITLAIDKWKSEKAIPYFCWHACPPSWNESACAWTDINKGQPEGFLDNILKAGTVDNKNWLARIDRVAGFLKQAQTAGVPVLWRPFHEMNGNWFWWCQQSRFPELWIQMYDRLTHFHGLNNLLWVYSANFPQDPVEKYYPGQNYVDILGLDIYENYGASYTDALYAALVKLANGKPIGITENGKIPPLDMFKSKQPDYVFFVTWVRFQNGGETSENSLQWTQATYSNPYLLTRDEIDFSKITTLLKPQNRTLSKSSMPNQILTLFPGARLPFSGEVYSLQAQRINPSGKNQNAVTPMVLRSSEVVKAKN
jgi:mannan endo-1,4-beta-mannosidase